MKFLGLLLASVMAFSIGGCASNSPDNSPNPYTQGNVTMNMKAGVTTQEQVAKAFGAPNIVTQSDDGEQSWIYQKNNVSVQKGSSGGYFSIGFAAVGSGSSGYNQSNQTMTLIIKFNKRGIVKDFKSMSTSF
jgi:outer membrane protein assembly factor BamE (lipoprotein component of BamABCDE complex)